MPSEVVIIHLFIWKGRDIMAVAEKIRSEEKAQETQIFEELDKGIDDMEAGRVIDHKEAMRILKERVNQYAMYL